jgi:hypothetical protein
MSMCSATEIRAFVSPKKTTDTEIEALITILQPQILAAAKTSYTGDANLKTCLIFSVCSKLLRKMKFSGELAANKKIGSAQQQNSIDQDIQDFEAQAKEALRAYQASNFKIVYGRAGPGTVDSS